MFLCDGVIHNAVSIQSCIYIYVHMLVLAVLIYIKIEVCGGDLLTSESRRKGLFCVQKNTDLDLGLVTGSPGRRFPWVSHAVRENSVKVSYLILQR